MPFTDIWDTTLPADTQAVSKGALDFRSLKLDIQQRFGAMTGVSTALPDLGSDAQPANWTGFLCFATDNGHVYRWSGSAWVDVSTISPSSALLVAQADLLTQTASIGNTTMYTPSSAGFYRLSAALYTTSSTVAIAVEVIGHWTQNGAFGGGVLFNPAGEGPGVGMESGAVYGYSDGAKPIQYSATVTGGGAGTSYDLHLRLESM